MSSKWRLLVFVTSYCLAFIAWYDGAITLKTVMRPAGSAACILVLCEWWYSHLKR